MGDAPWRRCGAAGIAAVLLVCAVACLTDGPPHDVDVAEVSLSSVEHGGKHTTKAMLRSMKARAARWKHRAHKAAKPKVTKRQVMQWHATAVVAKRAAVASAGAAGVSELGRRNLDKAKAQADKIHAMAKARAKAMSKTRHTKRKHTAPKRHVSPVRHIKKRLRITKKRHTKKVAKKSVKKSATQKKGHAKATHQGRHVKRQALIQEASRLADETMELMDHGIPVYDHYARTPVGDQWKGDADAYDVDWSELRTKEEARDWEKDEERDEAKAARRRKFIAHEKHQKAQKRHNLHIAERILCNKKREHSRHVHPCVLRMRNARKLKKWPLRPIGAQRKSQYSRGGMKSHLDPIPPWGDKGRPNISRRVRRLAKKKAKKKAQRKAAVHFVKKMAKAAKKATAAKKAARRNPPKTRSLANLVKAAKAKKKQAKHQAKKKLEKKLKKKLKALKAKPSALVQQVEEMEEAQAQALLAQQNEKARTAVARMRHAASQAVRRARRQAKRDVEAAAAASRADEDTKLSKVLVSYRKQSKHEAMHMARHMARHAARRTADKVAAIKAQDNARLEMLLTAARAKVKQESADAALEADTHLRTMLSSVEGEASNQIAVESARMKESSKERRLKRHMRRSTKRTSRERLLARLASLLNQAAKSPAVKALDSKISRAEQDLDAARQEDRQ